MAVILDAVPPLDERAHEAAAAAFLARLAVDNDRCIDNPLVAICEDAGLTPFEYEAVAMTANGLSARRIGRMQWPRKSEEAVRAAERRGLATLRISLVSA